MIDVQRAPRLPRSPFDEWCASMTQVRDVMTREPVAGTQERARTPSQPDPTWPAAA
jgi:hypothetical protein